MSQAAPTRPEVATESFEEALSRELERRVIALGSQAEAPALGAIDWVITAGLCVGLPLLLVWVLR